MENAMPSLHEPTIKNEDNVEAILLDGIELSRCPNIMSINQLPEECMITQEDIEEMKATEDISQFEDEADEQHRTSESFDSEECSKVKMRQIASVLLSDSSESDTDGDEVECRHLSESTVQKIQEEMYTAIKTQILKCIDQDEPYAKAWIDQQKIMYLRRKDKMESRKNIDEQIDTRENERKITRNSTAEIPKFTTLTVRPHYSKKQIEEIMTQMDKEKRERWEKLFIQFELSKSIRPPILRSDLRKDFNRLQGHNGQEDLVQYYRNVLNNLKDDVRSSVTKLEQIMNDLDAEQVKSQGVNKTLSVDVLENANTDEEERDQKSESTEVSSTSEDELFLTEQEIDGYEQLLEKNVVVAPNLQQIKKLLEIKLVFPENEKEIIKLGCPMREVEQRLLESKGLKSYISRIVYFYTYKSNCNADSVKKAYGGIIKDVRNSKESESFSNKGCLLIYENVKMVIVMVEGTEYEILKHLTKFRNSFSSSVKRGKILYVHRNLLKLYFNKWVTRVESPPAGKITYLTKSKKVLYRTAASRVVRLSEMLHRLYRHLSKEERYLVDPRSIYIKSKYLVMLPSPAIFGYLMKYSLLRDLKRFIEEIGMPLDLNSDDEELFAFTEDITYSNYIDSDEDEIRMKKLNYVKDVIKQSDVGKISKIKNLNDLKIKETDDLISWDKYSMDEVTPTIIDSRIKFAEDEEHPAVRLASAVEAHQLIYEDKKPGKLINRPSNELLTFLEKGSERWDTKINWHGLHIYQGDLKHEVKEEEGLQNEMEETQDPPVYVDLSNEEESEDYEDSFSEESSSESLDSN